MSTNPFDHPDSAYFVLVNDEGRHSLWPAFAAVPVGWQTIHQEDSREACLEYIADNWTDIRPKSAGSK